MILQLKKRLDWDAKFFSNPARVIVLSFLLLVVLGTLLLMLPMCSRSGESLDFSSALFTATSATCVTGLVVVDTFTHFTLGGQLIILFLIQLGGLGLVTFTTFFNLMLRKKIGLKSLYTAKESVSSSSLVDVSRVLKMIFIMTVCFEGIGALVLSTVMVPEFGPSGFYMSIFTAVSAFCNAGFDLMGFIEPFSNLTAFSSNPVVLITIMALIVSGGLGFIVWTDIIGAIKVKRISLHTKIVLLTSGSLILIGGLLFLIFEWQNTKTIGTMPVGDKILNSFFLAVSSRTAGFNTFPIENMYGISKLFCVISMFIGAAPGSTGGGIKVTTIIVIFMTVLSVFKGREDTIINKHKVEKNVVYKALAVTVLALFAVFVSTATIFFTSHSGVSFKEIDSLFEAVSAFGTVGLSSGVTTLANSASRYVLVLTMFIGRVGPVSLALSLALRNHDKSTVLPEGKILVG